MKFAIALFDILFIVIFWSLHLLFMAFTTGICWVGGDCPDPFAFFISEYHVVDVLVTTLILFIAIRVWKAILESIAKDEMP